MATILTVEQTQTNLGISTLTCNIPSTGIYNVKVFAEVYKAAQQGADAGAGSDKGLGVSGGVSGIAASLPPTALGQGGLGLGFGGSVTDGATGLINGYGATGIANASVIPVNDIVPNSIAAVSSALVILVKKNGATIFTAPTLSDVQRSVQFQFVFAATAADVITIVPSSANASDASVRITASVGAGL
jgi:hypothetical protein